MRIEKTTLRYLFLGVIFLAVFATSYSQSSYSAEKYKETGDSYRLQKNKLSAVEYYKKSLQKNSNFVPTLVAMGTLMREFGSLRESLEFLLKAYKLNENNKLPLLELIKTEIALGNIGEAENYLKKGLQQFPQEADFDYLQARIYLIKNQYYLAEKKLKQVIRGNPGHVDSHIALGELYMNEKRYQQSRSSFEKARLIEPENPDVFIGLFEVNFKSALDKKESSILDKPVDMSQFEDSIEYLLNAKEYDNDYIPANILLGKLYALANQCNKAQDYLNAVLKINPDHAVARYYLGYCFPDKNMDLYRGLLQNNQNNEILRYSYERNLTRYSQRRENKYLLDMAREHYEQGMGLFKSHLTNHGVFEMNWSAYLYPSFILPHKELLDHYRVIRDIVKMTDELNFLRKVSGEVKYQDMYEMLVARRKDKLYYQEKIYRPEKFKTPTPLFVFHFTPEDVLGDYPDAGEAIADKLIFALQEGGKIQVLSGSQREEAYSLLSRRKAWGKGIYYNPRNGKLALDFMRANLSGNPDYVRYAITGKYKEIPGGLDVRAEIIDLETGISFAPFHIKSSGRGFIRDIVIKLAYNIFRNIPFYGKIIKISSNGVIVNLGEREGITKKTLLGVYRDRKKMLDIEISSLDTDILWAKTKNYSDLYKMQPGDIIIVQPQKAEQKK